MNKKAKKILIIEDNTDVRENLAEILELTGYETVEAENGKVGIAKVREHHPDLILCDVMMPELDGFGVLKILNQQEELMHIPFMFLTAKADKIDFRKGMGLGADDYITKPYDDVELLETIQMRLKKSENLQRVDNTKEGLKMFINEAKGLEALKELSDDREIRQLHKKEIIYQAHQFPRWVYFVNSGAVKCSQKNDFGKELITNIYSEGDFFGFVPILKEGKYEDTAVVLEDAEISLIPPEDFKLLLFNNRDVSAKFIKMLAHHADHSERQLIDLAYSSVRKKVANALIVLHEKSEDGSIAVMRDDLAALAGTAKETTVRTLTDFKNEGLLRSEDKVIFVEDLKALKEMPQ